MRAAPFPLRAAGGLVAANGANNGVALALTLAAAATLAPAAFGALGLALALVVVLAALSDWGLGVAVLRLTAGGADAARAVLAWKTLLAVVLVLAGCAVPPAALATLWPVAFDRALLVTTLLSAGLLGCWSSLRALEQAREDFAAMRRATFACAAVRVATFALAWSAGLLSPLTLLACLYVVPLGVLLAWRACRSRPRGAATVPLGQLLRAAAWPGLSALCFIAYTRAPVLLPGAAGSAEQLAVHGAALTLVLACALLGDAARAVLLPRIVRARAARERARVRVLLRHTLEPWLFGAMALLCVAAVLYARVLGMPYAAGAPMVLVMGLATLVTAWLGLHTALLHALARPELEAAVNAGRLLVLALLLPWLPPGALALATAYATVLIGGELVLLACVHALERGAAPRRAALAGRP
jgi:O-antigen/teichoic acid export membrane protein